MKSIIRFTFLLFATIGLVGCGGEGTDTGPDNGPEVNENEPSEPKSMVEGIPFDPDAIYLERMYATSVGNNGPEYLLDGDPSSSWDAVKGAGPNEGIMFYFENPVEVGSINVRSKEGAPGIASMECFVNGAAQGQILLDQEKSINEEVQSLFLRIDAVNGQKDLEFGDYPYYIIHEYPYDLQVYLSEVEFKDKEGNPLKVRPLHLESGVVVPSSTLEPVEAYNGDYLFDSNLEFGWAEGKEDEGVGEKIQFTFDRGVRVEKIKIWNGYQRSQRHFERNARAKSVNFGLMGEKSTAFELADEQGGQVLELPEAIEGNEFELTVNDFYAGESYTDLVISEFRFFDGQQWFGVQSSGFEQRKADLHNKLADSFLKDMLDKPHYQYQDMEMDGDVSYSLTLRSSGSFVLYRNRSEGDDGTRKSTEIREVADGNWSIESKTKSTVKVKIFGKLNRIMEKEYWYKGATKSDMTRIFSEILTITKDKITGQKLIDEMLLTVPDEGSDATGQIEPVDTGGQDMRFAYPGSDVMPEFQVILEG